MVALATHALRIIFSMRVWAVGYRVYLVPWPKFPYSFWGGDGPRKHCVFTDVFMGQFFGFVLWCLCHQRHLLIWMWWPKLQRTFILELSFYTIYDCFHMFFRDLISIKTKIEIVVLSLRINGQFRRFILNYFQDLVHTWWHEKSFSFYKHFETAE